MPGLLYWTSGSFGLGFCACLMPFPLANKVIKAMKIDGTLWSGLVCMLHSGFTVWYGCSGSRSGYIHHHDVRVAQHLVGSLPAHQQEVCGLKWSPDGKYLASGGNDNLLNIWLADPGTYCTSNTPVYTFSQHQAAVKASYTAFISGCLCFVLMMLVCIPISFLTE